MKLVKVRNNKIIQTKLPKTGTLKDGTTVSGYNLLNKNILYEEGWLPLEDVKPNYNHETQCLIENDYNILDDKVIKTYRIVEKPQPRIVDGRVDDEKIALAEALVDLENRIRMLEEGK